MSRTPDGKWLPGVKQKAGPGRMPGRGLAQYIRDQSRDGYELAEWCFRVLRGFEKGATAQDKRFAVEFLANRGFGKAPEVSLIGQLGEVDNPLAEISSEMLRTLIRVEPGADNTTLPASASAPALPDASPAAVNAPPSAQSLEPVPTQPPPAKPYSEAPKCSSCGMRRAHTLVCPERPANKEK